MCQSKVKKKKKTQDNTFHSIADRSSCQEVIWIKPPKDMTAHYWNETPIIPK